MIEVNISGLEQLSDNVSGISSDVEELLIRLETLKSEVSIDTQLAAYPQYTSLIELLNVITGNVSRVNDALLTLQTVFSDAVNEYNEQETRFMQQFDAIFSTISTLYTSLAIAETSEIKPVEVNKETETTDSLQQLVASVNDEMQVTNISTVAITIEEEYTISGNENRLQQELIDKAEFSGISVDAAQNIHIKNADEIADEIFEQAQTDTEE